MKKEITKKRVLMFDIETMANLGYIWGKYEQNVIAYEQEWYILCFCWKWLGEDKVHSMSIIDNNKDLTNDRKVVQKLHELFSEADIVVAHNGDQFDIKKVNARFLYHGMTPPTPYKTVDTKKVAKGKFAFNSNKLDDLGEILGVGRKFKHQGFSLWQKCAKGDKKAWAEMIKYNKQDVILLEKVYLKLLPYMTTFPSIRTNEFECLNCESMKVHKRGKCCLKGGNFKQRFQCQDCGAWGLSNVIKT